MLRIGVMWGVCEGNEGSFEFDSVLQALLSRDDAIGLNLNPVMIELVTN